MMIWGSGNRCYVPEFPQVCRTCGEEYFAPQVVDELHRIIEARAWTETLEVPYAKLKASAG